MTVSSNELGYSKKFEVKVINRKKFEVKVINRWIHMNEMHQDKIQ